MTPTPRIQVESRLRDLTERCHAAGMNLTPQRLSIYRALLEARDHPTPEEIYERVKPGMPSLSLATIYKTLDSLVRLELVAELPATGQRRRYDANMERHQHLVCSGCGEVTDIHHPALDRVAPPRDLGGFAPHHLSIQIHGLCHRCARAERAR